MKNIRIGNDINFRWKIRRGESAESFEGKKISVLLRDCFGHRCELDWHTEQGGFIVGTSYGYTQHCLGLYTLTLVENDGGTGMNTVDSIDVWRLVPRQNNAMQGDDECSNLQTEVIELTSDIAVGNDITIDTELSATSINPVQNKAVTQALNEKLTEDIAREKVQNGKWLSVSAGRDEKGNIIDGAVAEGKFTKASAFHSHAEGNASKALAENSHAEGEGSIAEGRSSHAEGAYNYSHENFIHSVGVGESANRINAETIYIARKESGEADTSNSNNGYKYLIGVGGYKGQEISDGVKSVQEVFVEHEDKLSTQQKKIDELQESIKKQAEAMFICNPGASVSVDDTETTLTPLRRNVIKGFTNIKIASSPENIVHAELHNFKPTTLYEMFYDCANLRTLDTSQWDTSEVTNMEKSFFRCKSLEQLDLSGWDTGNVTEMGGMFYQCTSLTKLNMQSFDMNGVTSAWGMFFQCLKLSELDLRNFTLPNVTDLSSLFYQCRALTSLNLSACNTGAATTMESMFHQCSTLQVLNIALFDLSSVTTCRKMFYQCGSITSLTLGEGFGKMKDSVGSVDFSAMTQWTDSTVQTLTSLYNRKAAGMGVITLKLSTQTKNALGSASISILTAKGYTIA